MSGLRQTGAKRACGEYGFAPGLTVLSAVGLGIHHRIDVGPILKRTAHFVSAAPRRFPKCCWLGPRPDDLRGPLQAAIPPSNIATVAAPTATAVTPPRVRAPPPAKRGWRAAGATYGAADRRRKQTATVAAAKLVERTRAGPRRVRGQVLKLPLTRNDSWHSTAASAQPCPPRANHR